MKKQNWFITIPLVILVVYGLTSWVYVLKSRTLKKMKPYIVAMEHVKDNETVVQQLGKPIQDGFLPSGHFSVNGDNGVASWSIELNGSVSSGELQVEATRKERVWHFNHLVFRQANGPAINLLQ